jgi:sugar-specific transcriptional regulator TrmB
MYIEQLQSFGLNQTEAKIYLALLELKEANITALGKFTGVHRRNIYDTIDRMLDKGIVFEIFEARERVFSPVEPHKLMELLREKEKILSKVIPDLENLFNKKIYDEAAYIYR